jgi:hypothetical protein
MGLDPLYAEVVVQRWEKFTGRKAERSKTSERAKDTAASPEIPG